MQGGAGCHCNPFMPGSAISPVFTIISNTTRSTLSLRCSGPGLPSDELLAAGNKAKEVAKLKVFEALFTMVINYGIRPTWEAYNSRIHFVNPGFRPTLADLTED